MAVEGRVRIGTSGWHYPHWRGPFYPATLPATRMLSWYSARFESVEINNTFYRLPRGQTFSAWRDATPPTFCFAVKGSRYLTHFKKLKAPAPALKRLMPRVDALGKKLGPVLFQIPPRWSLNLERLNEFLDALPQRHRYAFEFRDRSWHDPLVYRALARHNAAFCIYELEGFVAPNELTADFAYLRLHGPGAKYQGSYSAPMLDRWAERITRWRGSHKAVYVYFDNDQAAFAVKNALALRAMLGLDT